MSGMFDGMNGYFFVIINEQISTKIKSLYRISIYNNNICFKIKYL